MDINQQVKPVIDLLLNDLRDSVEKELTNNLSILIDNLTSQINAKLVDAANLQISNEITREVSKINVNAVVNNVIKSKLETMVQELEFPEQSIPYTSVNFSGVEFSGDNIKGGIIENFGSTGIEDRSTFVQMTLMDHATVFEGPVFAPDIQIKGNLIVDGDFILSGEFPTESTAFTKLIEHSSTAVKSMLNDDLFTSFSNIIYTNILENGISLDKINQDGKTVLAGNKLGYHITDTNIQRVGMIRDLQTIGENYLSETLYVSGHRVGINTMEPSAALSVWDEECEIVALKRKTDVGYIGMPRQQKLVLGSNNKDNLILDVDGSVKIEQLTINQVAITSSPVIPTTNGKFGQIVLNERPALGRPIGWVSIGAGRWASFGKIE